MRRHQFLAVMLLSVFLHLFLLLLLQQAMDLEPIRSSAVSGTALRHTDHHALPQSARFARGSVLFVDDAFVVVLAVVDRVDVVVGSSEE